jgi:hypothetical protein
VPANIGGATFGNLKTIAELHTSARGVVTLPVEFPYAPNGAATVTAEVLATGADLSLFVASASDDATCRVSIRVEWCRHCHSRSSGDRADLSLFVASASS